MRNLALEKPPVREAKRIEREPAKHSNDGRPLIVIDPGHGGPDTGTIASSGEMEKAIVLEFAQALSEKLEKSGKYRVLMTRTDDRFVPLGERVRIARHEGAALFVSIHADALASRREAGRARRDRLHGVGHRLGPARPRSLPRTRTRPTRSRASICPPSPRRSPTS